jgi:predicted RNA-binding protein with PIN domain
MTKENQMAETQVAFTVPKEIIDSHVKAAVAQVLSRDPEALIKAVVDTAMQQKDPGSFGRETIWEKTFNNMVREVAQATFAKWIEEQRPAIERAVRARLDSKERKDLIAKVAERLAGSLGQFRVRIDIDG